MIAPPIAQLLPRLADWPVQDQGNRGTCVAFAVVACYEFKLRDVEKPRFSEQFLHWAIKTHTADPLPNADDTFLQFAKSAITSLGVCLAHDWSYDPNEIRGNVTHARPPHVPSLTAIQHAIAYRLERSTAFQSFVEQNIADASKPSTQIRALLDAGHPVALTVEVWRDPSNDISNWTTGEAVRLGMVMEPRAGMRRSGEGHAVCALCFISDEDAPGGGYFIVRNSFGVKDFGRDAPDERCHVPAPGYGQISAEYIDHNTWEYYAL